MAQDQQPFLRDVGARLAEVRRTRGLTQEQLAEIVGVDPQTIQRAETGRTSLSLLRIRRVADALDVNLGELFREVGAEMPEQWLEPGAAELLAVWSGVPEARRALALRVLRAFSQE